MARSLRILVPLLLLLHAGATALGGTSPETLTVTIGGTPFSLELASDPAGRYRGLSNRPAPASGTGMLFVFPFPAQVSFCMRDCAFPIDILFLDAHGRLLSWTTMAMEPRQVGEGDREYNARLTAYPSPPRTQFIIELPGGTMRGLTVAPGETVITIPRALADRAK